MEEINPELGKAEADQKALDCLGCAREVFCAYNFPACHSWGGEEWDVKSNFSYLNNYYSFSTVYVLISVTLLKIDVLKKKNYIRLYVRIVGKISVPLGNLCQVQLYFLYFLF